MAHWRQNHETDSNHLKSHDLYDEKRSTPDRPAYLSPVLRIERVSVDVVKSKEKPRGERRNFIHLKGNKPIKKPLGLNVTNCETLESISGSPDPKSWVGLVIQLYVDPQARYPSGKRGPAIRIKPKAATAAPEATVVPEVSEATRERLEQEHEDRLEREPGSDAA